MKKHKKGKEEPKTEELDPVKEERPDICIIDEAEKDKSDEIVIDAKEEKEPEKKERSKEEEYYDRLIRMAADFDNFKKRVQKEKADYVKFATERLIKEMIPVVDNLERGLESARSANDKETIVKGIELILNQILTVLKREGLEPVESKGKEFDPLIHEAISHIPSKEAEPNTVIDEQLKAYFLNKKLIRPAKVVVSKEVMEEPQNLEKDVKGNDQGSQTDKCGE